MRDREWWHWPLLAIEALAWCVAIPVLIMLYMIHSARVAVPTFAIGLFLLVLFIWLVQTFFATLGF